MPCSRLILATGSDELDRYYQDLAEDGRIQVSARVFYREAVLDAVKRHEADVLLLSAYLEGTKDLRDVAFEARLAGLRVVFLAGDTPRQSQLVKDLIAMGVYDILFYGEEHVLRVEDIDSCIAAPRTFAEVLKECSITARPQPKRDLFALFKTVAGLVCKKGGANGAGPAENSSPETPAKEATRTEKSASRRRRIPEAQDTPLVAEPGEVLVYLQKPVVTVWSPAACGKTFISIALARALAARGIKVALVDLDTQKQAAHTYLKLPDGEDSLGEVLSPALVVTDGPFGIKCEKFTVFSRDPGLKPLDVQVRVLERFLNSPKVSAEVFLCDMPSMRASWVSVLLNAASVRVLVADPDPARIAVVKRDLKKVPCDYLVLNRVTENNDISRILRRKPDCVVPEVKELNSLRTEVVGVLADAVRDAVRQSTCA